MNVFLEQLILGVRRNDFEGWMQILVFVAMIIVYSLSSIFKAKMKKTEPEEEKEGPRRPRQGDQPQRRKITRPQPAVQKVAAKAERPVRVPATGQQAKQRLSISIPQPQPGVRATPKSDVRMQKLPEFTGKAISELEGKRVGATVVSKESADIRSLDEILLDYADPDELRRAILHYEILGKPLSLRGPRENIF